jgi:hypothetical protein
MVDPLSGDASNLGSNDGTLLFKLDACDYRDFRPSLQLASVVLRNACLYGEGPWNTILAVFGLSYEPSPLPIALVGKKFNQGGYVCFRGKGHWAVLKYPRYRYRPPQCDALHVDVWGAGENIFLDSGTYSYNASALEMADFSGVKGHNTLQFDHREQMPRISRFLYGGWLKTKNMYYGALSDTEQGWSGLYHDAWGVTHQRTILLESTQYRIVDRFSGFKESAVILWHSPFLDWVKTESGYRRKNILIEVRVNGKLIELQNRKSEVSRYYLNKEPCTVFIYEIKDSPGTIETLILINPES